MEKVALVTGGGRGIGYGIVRALGAEGWNVAFCGRKDASAFTDKLETLRQEFSGKFLYVQCDVSKPEDRQTLLNSILKEFGRLDALVNNAGVAPEVRADILEMTEDSFDRVMNINLKGPFFLTQLIGNYFAANKIAGTILNIGSISATVASISRGEYCLSKAAVAMATKLYAVRMADFGVNVYEIRPGVIASDMTSVVKEKYDKLIAGGLTLEKRWGYPEDIGRAAAALLRGDFAYSTGQVIKVDGGMEIGRL